MPVAGNRHSSVRRACGPVLADGGEGSSWELPQPEQPGLGERGTGTSRYLLGRWPNCLGLWELLGHLITVVLGV